MSSTAMCRAPAIIVFTLFIAMRGWAFDEGLSGFVKASDRSADPLILSLMSGADLPARLDIAAALGTRSDPYAGDILESLSAGFDKSRRFENELVLRTLLSSLFPPSIPAETRGARLDANRAALDAMVRRLMDFSDPQLAALLVKTAASLGDAEYRPILAERARVLIDVLEDNGGMLRPEDGGLLLSLLDFFRAHPSEDFLPLCLDVARLSREKAFVESARTAAAQCAVAADPRGASE
jgi:hypothetical protein